MATATKPVENGHRLVTFAELQEMPAPYEDVTLPEMGGVSVRLFAVSGVERTRLGTMAQGQKDDDLQADLDFTCAVVSACMPDSTAEAVAALPATVIQRLARVAFRLTGTGERAIEQALEALKATPNADNG